MIHIYKPSKKQTAFVGYKKLRSADGYQNKADAKTKYVVTQLRSWWFLLPLKLNQRFGSSMQAIMKWFSYTYIKSVSKRVFQTSFPDSIIVMRYELLYHLYNLKSVKNTCGGVLLLVKLQAGNASFIVKCNVLNMKCKSMHWKSLCWHQ